MPLRQLMRKDLSMRCPVPRTTTSGMIPTETHWTCPPKILLNFEPKAIFLQALHMQQNLGSLKRNHFALIRQTTRRPVAGIVRKSQLQ
jgi:hypothetical protein